MVDEHSGEGSGRAQGMPGEALDALAVGVLAVLWALVILFLACLLAGVVWMGALCALAWWLFSLPVRLIARAAHEARR